MKPNIHFDTVTLSFNKERPLFTALNLNLSEARIGIIGLNGSGKTTFMRMINGLELPTSGHVRVDGFDTKKEGKRVRELVGFVFQNPEHQIICPTVKEDLAFGLKGEGFSKEEIKSKVQAALKLYGLEHLEERLTHTLSAGERQMVALLGVTITSTSHLVLDEPTALLDLKQRGELMRAVETMEQQVILATHQLDLLENFDRVIGFDQGKIFVDDHPKEALRNITGLK